MVGISGLGGIPEPKSERPASTKTERTDASASAAKAASSASGSDGVNISLEAKAAAEVGRIVALTRSQDEIRAEKVEAARQRLLAGSYRDPDVVAKVAEKLIKFLAWVRLFLPIGRSINPPMGFLCAWVQPSEFVIAQQRFDEPLDCEAKLSILTLLDAEAVIAGRITGLKLHEIEKLDAAQDFREGDHPGRFEVVRWMAVAIAEQWTYRESVRLFAATENVRIEKLNNPEQLAQINYAIAIGICCVAGIFAFFSALARTFLCAFGSALSCALLHAFGSTFKITFYRAFMAAFRSPLRSPFRKPFEFAFHVAFNRALG